MAIIKAPNKKYTGKVGGVGFVDGVGKTDSSWLIEWFKKSGYTVEEEKKAKESALDILKAEADELEIEYPKNIKKKELESLIEAKKKAKELQGEAE